MTLAVHGQLEQQRAAIRAYTLNWGTIEDFRRLVLKAEEHGLEVALDIALQCTPDHP